MLIRSAIARIAAYVACSIRKPNSETNRAARIIRSGSSENEASDTSTRVRNPS